MHPCGGLKPGNRANFWEYNFMKRRGRNPSHRVYPNIVLRRFKLGHLPNIPIWGMPLHCKRVQHCSMATLTATFCARLSHAPQSEASQSCGSESEYDEFGLQRSCNFSDLHLKAKIRQGYSRESCADAAQGNLKYLKSTAGRGKPACSSDMSRMPVCSFYLQVTFSTHS